MRFFLWLILFPLIYLLISNFQLANAQSCSGSYTCGWIEVVCLDDNGKTCVPNPFNPECTCGQQLCRNQGNAASCSSITTQNSCNNPCGSSDCVFDGCSWNSGPAPTSPPGGGSASTCDTSQNTTTATYNECGAFGRPPNQSCPVRKFTYNDPDCTQADQFELNGACHSCSNGCNTSTGTCNVPPTNTPVPTTPPGVP